MTEYQFATYELLLDTSETPVQKSKTVQVGLGEPFTMKCTVKGEHHEDHDLSWLKDGKEILEIDALNVTDSSIGGSPSKSVFVSSFNATKHGGLYECSVKRKDKKYHFKGMRLEQKPGNIQIADGFIACPAHRQNRCLNGGICMMHKASESLSCLCPHDNIGRQCEKFAVGDVRHPVLSEYHRAAVMGFSTTIVAIFFLIAVFCYSMKKRRQIKRLNQEIDDLRSLSNLEQEKSPLNHTDNQLNTEILAKIESGNVRDDQYCSNCFSARFRKDESINANLMQEAEHIFSTTSVGQPNQPTV